VADDARVIEELRQLVDDHGGTAISAPGAGLTAIFTNASDGVGCAVAMQQKVVLHTTLQVGVELSIGDINDEEPVGRPLVQAALLCASAGPGQILAARSAAMVAGRQPGVAYLDIDPVASDQSGEPVDVVEVDWRRARARPVRVLLADDAVLIRQGIVRLLADEGFDVVGQVGDAQALVAMATDRRPDLVITDVRMPPAYALEGLEAALQLRRQYPGLGILILSQYLETRYAVELLGDGARGVGYLLKERISAVEEFVSAALRVADGGTAIDPEMVALLMTRSGRHGGLARLSVRENEILSSMAEGLSNAAIARRLTLGIRTVESHVGNIFTKLDLLPDLDDDRRVLAVIQHLRGISTR
jgi:DNA-binding NarL/FixJ family response regulator